MRKFRPAQSYDFVQGTFVANPTTPKRNTKPTNALTKAIEDYVSLRGGYAMRINVAGFYRQDIGYIRSGSTVGVSDLIAVVKGRLIAIEIKTGKDTQSEAQKAVQANIKAANGVYLIARDFDQFRVELF
ncbi:MAG: hypothetical protein EAZ32_12435 [Cytophagia bacterium]|nr:MAG: hypothetical protein EAZ38_13070 [Cytophagales bacterium]TAG38442.1 MAG: hypothetical protein EAZ32_12435 [Cytophagia bacterium]TAG53581.1 MAG: hypothetical protein EAZ29_05500 [Runella slithyformis]TAG65429.1 MAG: hypothetical protein EAZ26_10485 [Runella slithyformis]TAG80021.1 MAG: hypothetical protein EAZ22_10375 [Cytophagales bacterium]